MTATNPSSERQADLTFVRRLFYVVAVAALVGSIYALSDVLLLLFGAILMAITLHAIAEPLHAWFGLGRRWAMLLGGVAVLVLLTAGAFYFGPDLLAQMRSVASTLPEAANRLAALLGLGSVADLLKDGTTASAIGGLASRVISWSTTIAGALGSLLLIVFGGIYLALDPQLYRNGLIKLAPPGIQSNIGVTLDEAGQALKQWLKGQALAMLMVGVCTGLGLWLVGVPSAFALGVIAALAEFVPIIGPILAAIPALLIASSQGVQTVGLALAVVVVVQQVESNLITPLIADRMVSIAPAFGLFAIIAMGVVFGPLGLLLGFPLVVVVSVAVRRLYVHDTLGRPVDTV